jgi:hypothetical protein
MIFSAGFARIPKPSSRVAIAHTGCLGLIIYFPILCVASGSRCQPNSYAECGGLSCTLAHVACCSLPRCSEGKKGRQRA